jgi:hypothetical protein
MLGRRARFVKGLPTEVKTRFFSRKQHSFSELITGTQARLGKSRPMIRRSSGSGDTRTWSNPDYFLGTGISKSSRRRPQSIGRRKCRRWQVRSSSPNGVIGTAPKTVLQDMSQRCGQYRVAGQSK